MHISDGIIDSGICMVANAASIVIIYFSGKKIPLDEIPKMGMMGAVIFVSSLVHFPLAGTSIHLGLYGVAGIILGKRAFPAIFAAVLFQSLVFQHGGLITTGVNALNMGAGALAAWFIWRLKFINETIKALLAGFFGVIVPVSLMTLEFSLSGYGRGIAVLFSVYIFAAIAEAAISLSVVKFLRKVDAEILS